MENKLLTPEAVGKILGGISAKTVSYSLSIPYIKVGGKRRYLEEDVKNYIKKNKKYTIDIKRNSVEKFIV